MQWEANNETPPGSGVLQVTAHSAVSGRALQVAVVHNGVGRGTAYVGETPRPFYIVVESANVDWSLVVQEGAIGDVPEGR